MARSMRFLMMLFVFTFVILMSTTVGPTRATSTERIELLSIPAFLQGAIRVMPDVAPGAADGKPVMLIHYAGSIVSRTDESVLHSFSLRPFETPYFSRSGRFFAIAGRDSPMDLRCDLTLYSFDGRVVWRTENLPSGAILISDDGRTVIAVTGPFVPTQESEIVFLDSEGNTVRSLRNEKIDPRRAGLSPDGSLFATVVGGEETDGVVTLSDKLTAYSGRGEFLWERVVHGAHFAGQLAVRNKHLFASFYVDGGRRHFIQVYDADGNHLAEVNPRIPNLGAYHLRLSPTRAYLAAFGHHHVVLVETKNGGILWEWEWKNAEEDQLIHECLVSDDGKLTVAVAYVGKLGRRILVFDEAGGLNKDHQYTVKESVWGNLCLVPNGDEILLLDNGSSRNVRFLR